MQDWQLKFSAQVNRINIQIKIDIAVLYLKVAISVLAWDQNSSFKKS